ncbi:hypothetical protein ASE93_15475 [Serratia sp. Leaf50]|nr:hypothetical protein ASE93_15475 [Serratia sp. Leaf50]
MSKFRLLSVYTANLIDTQDGSSSVINQSVFGFDEFPAKINFLAGAYLCVPKEDQYFSLIFDVFDEEGQKIHPETHDIFPLTITEFVSHEGEHVFHLVFQPEDHILLRSGTYKLVADLVKDEVKLDTASCFFMASSSWSRAS